MLRVASFVTVTVTHALVQAGLSSLPTTVLLPSCRLRLLYCYVELLQALPFLGQNLLHWLREQYAVIN